MKKIAGIILVICVLASFASCTKDAYVPSGYKRISDDDAPYRLYVPEDWTEDISTSVTSAYVSSTDKSNISFYGCEVDDTIIQAKVNVDKAEDTTADTQAATTEEVTEAAATDATTETVTEAGTETAAETDAETQAEILDADDFWAYYEKEFSRTFDDMTYIENGKNCTVSGIESKRYEYTATVTGTVYRFMQTVTVTEGYAYIFTYTALPDNYETNLETVEQILGYIEIK